MYLLSYNTCYSRNKGMPFVMQTSFIDMCKTNILAINCSMFHLLLGLNSKWIMCEWLLLISTEDAETAIIIKY